MKYGYILRISILMLCFFRFAVSEAQRDTVVYDTRTGLSHWIVSDVMQDRNGFIWLATWNGLNRYDGYTFRHIKTRPGDGTSVASEVIRYMVPDRSGNIVCFTDAGVFRFNMSAYAIEDVSDSVGRDIKNENHGGRLTDSNGNEWKVERYGIRKVTHHVYPAQAIDEIENMQARAFFRDRKNDRWWVSTKEDECIRVYDNSNQFVGYLGGDGRIHAEQTPFGYRPYCIMQSSGGDIWMGCKPGALLRLRSRADGTYNVERMHPSGLTTDVIYDIAEDSKGRLWLATFGGGLQCISNPEAEQPECINFLDHESGVFARGMNKVRRILVTRSGNIVCATTDGIVVCKTDQHDIRNSVLKRIRRDGKNVNSLCGNATMDVIYGMNDDIFIASEYSGVDMTTEESLLSDAPSFRHFNTAGSSLTSDVCLSMTLKNDGRLLVVSTDRVTDFNPYADEAATYLRKFWGETLHFSESRPMLLPDSSWVFGQEQGAYIVTRQAMQSDGDAPPLLFTELSIAGREPQYDVCLRNEIVLRADERSMVLSFAALDYTDNSGILYRTRVNGREWSHAGTNRTISFHDMQPGTFTLEIQSTDRYGRWSDNNRTLTVTLEPYWYETLWARIAAWAASLGVILAVVYVSVYVRRLRQQRSKLLEDYMRLLHEQTGQKSVAAEQNQPSLPEELSEEDRRFLEKVKRYIQENIANGSASIEKMAEYAATSRSNLNRKLRSLVGITAAQLLIEARMQRAKQMLGAATGAERVSVTDVAYACGYSDARYFARCFKQKYGISPSEYAQGKGCNAGIQDGAKRE